VKQLWGFGGSFGGSIAALVCMTQTAWAAPSQIVEVRTSQTASGINVVLQTQNGERPQVFAVNRGNTWVADVVNSNLNLPNGGAFRQDNPAPGIASVLVLPADANSVRVIVTGQGGVPEGKVTSAVERGVVLSIAATPSQGTAASADVTPGNNQASQSEVPPALQLSQSGQPLFPDPGITIDGNPVPRPTMVPPNLPRAKAPPVGDIAISDLGVMPPSIDLGSADQVPRLVLREAPVREVLALLARAAGLNLAFTPGEVDPQQQQMADDAAFGGRITLDIENESVQDVFNYVLRLSGLQATRVGNTIFVSKRLPNSARDIVIRTLRLNQTSATEASGYLVALGAESAVTETTTVPVVTQITVPGADPIIQTFNTQRTTVNTLRINPEDSVPIFRGMQVLVDPRTNSLTLVGERRIVDMAATQLSRIDVRNRQVAVNVKIINVDLSNQSNWTASYTFGLNNRNNVVVNNQTLGIQGLVYNFASPGFGGNNFGINLREFLGSLSASIQSGNSKILTDPTLVVQEGQSATVTLQDQIVSEVTATVSQVQGVGQTVTVETEFEDVGLRLAVNVSRIDDNGFVTLSVSPEVRAPLPRIDLGQVQGISVFVTPISERSVSSGVIRLRDGQTLVLTGIVQESETSVVSKVPILGDIPILGALFRNTNNLNQRSEVIVLLTPQILDDSAESTAFGYNYTPGSDARNILQNNTVRTGN